MTDYDCNEKIELYVDPYEYKPDGKGVQITAGGGVLIATVRGTSYPLGSACESDVALARKMAAGPNLYEAAKRALIVLEGIATIRSEGDAICQLEAAIKKAEAA